MAQRVYLIPTPGAVRDLFEEAVLAQAPAEFEDVLARLKARAARHQRVNGASKRNAKRLDSQRFEAAGRGDDYHRCTALRPYLLTSPRPEQAVSAIATVLAMDDDADIQRFFEGQLAGLPAELVDEPAAAPANAEDWDWQAIQADLSRLRDMRAAILRGDGYTVERLKEGDVAGMRVLTSETEPLRLKGAELTATFGRIAGFALARTSGYAEPSWWLGRNFWLGLIVATRFGPLSFLRARRLRPVRDALRDRGDSPAVLLRRIAVDGFEEGFSLSCDAYGSGLYFSPDAVAWIAGSLRDHRDAWLALARKVTGYQPGEVAQLMEIVFEAVLWASREGLGLVEADEAVGASGYR